MEAKDGAPLALLEMDTLRRQDSRVAIGRADSHRLEKRRPSVSSYICCGGWTGGVCSWGSAGMGEMDFLLFNSLVSTVPK